MSDIDILWQKEWQQVQPNNAYAASDSPLYMDLFSSPSICMGAATTASSISAPIVDDEWEDLERIKEIRQFPNGCVKKDNFLANENRSLAQIYFKHEKWPIAMIYYNKTLCYAEPTFKFVGLMFLERSECFFQMKEYTKSIYDIQLALANGLPDHNTIDIALKRKHNCEQQLLSLKNKKEAKNAGNDSKTVISVVSYKENENGLLCAFARREINVDEIVHMSQCYIGENYFEKYSTCVMCNKSGKNMIPCKVCTVAMFCCDVTCTNSADLHQFECGIRPYILPSKKKGFNFQNPVVRSIMMASRLFDNNVDTLMSFVEEILPIQTREESAKLLRRFDDPATARIQNIAEYIAFFKLGNAKKYQSVGAVQSIFNAMLQQANIANIFNSTKYQRFLAHLIMHHFSAFNHSMIQWNGYGEFCSLILTVENTTTFHHSCRPNVMFVPKNGTIVGYAICRIQAGEQLVFDRFNSISKFNYYTRHTYLYNTVNYICDCDQCKLQINTTTDSLVSSHTAYFYFIYKYKLFNAHRPVCTYEMQQSLEKKLKKMCVGLLTVFGGRNDEERRWSQEIVTLVEILKHLYMLI